MGEDDIQGKSSVNNWVTVHTTAAGKGSKQSLAKLLEYFERPAYAFLLGRVKNREVAEDLLAETKLRVLEGFERFDGRPFLPWFLGVAHYVALEFRRENLKLDAAKEALQKEAVRGFLSAQSSKASEELGGRILEAVEACPEEYRLPLLLRYMDEKSYEEIAVELQLSLGQVKGLIYRGTQMLRELLAAEYGIWQKKGGRKNEKQ
jgi:RNA polymerase sigma-70 factor (ECF subfamily)